MTNFQRYAGAFSAAVSANLLKAIPHKDCARIARSDFSADCTKTTTAGWRLPRSFWAICRKICKLDVCKAVRRSLCGIALRQHRTITALRALSVLACKFSLKYAGIPASNLYNLPENLLTQSLNNNCAVLL